MDGISWSPDNAILICWTGSAVHDIINLPISIEPNFLRVYVLHSLSPLSDEVLQNSRYRVHRFFWFFLRTLYSSFSRLLNVKCKCIEIIRSQLRYRL